ncbi:MAG: MBL fold metallo-hydrolase [Pyrinomonadaceae bacterium]|nr:MBL fold metallo-hydrolase [Pyrinomonadaceae bacterium]
MIFLILAGLIVYGEMDETIVADYVRDEGLKSAKQDFQGTPVDQKGRFVNIEYPFLPSFVNLMRWKLGGNPQAQEKKNDKSPLKIFDPTGFFNGENDGIIWLGHASVLIRLEGKTILIDPVFGNPSFIDRYFELPSPLGKIKNVDYVLTSHDHRDHLDEPTIRAIAEKFPDAKFLAGIGSEDVLYEWTGRKNRVKTAGWYEQFAIDDEDVRITFVPVRHWSRRWINDTNRRLWGGYIIQGGGKTFYHGGDSGYGNHYAEMGEVFGEIDYFIIGIGSYAPRWFMKPNHNNPEDAWKAFKDSKAKYLVPMHYATFNMTDEPPSEPLRRLKRVSEKKGEADKVRALQIYESLVTSK